MQDTQSPRPEAHTNVHWRACICTRGLVRASEGRKDPFQQTESDLDQDRKKTPNTKEYWRNTHVRLFTKQSAMHQSWGVFRLGETRAAEAAQLTSSLRFLNHTRHLRAPKTMTPGDTKRTCRSPSNKPIVPLRGGGGVGRGGGVQISVTLVAFSDGAPSGHYGCVSQVELT
jgi:hypothetical protein